MVSIGYAALIDEISLELGFCGCIKDDQIVHVSLFIPSSGPISAEQFADWALLANDLNPNAASAQQSRDRTALRDAFIRHMGAETVDARRLSWDQYEADMLGDQPEAVD